LPLSLVGALAIGLSLGLLGSGGSILTVPVLHHLVGQPDKLAIGGALLVVGLIAAAGCVPYALHRQVDWRNVVRFGLPGMAGSWLGATLARWVPGPAQLALLAGVPMLSAVGTSLAVISLNSFSGFGKYRGILEQDGLVLDWRVLLMVAAIGVAGSIAGHRLGRRLPQAAVRRLFGAFLVVMGIVITADAARRLLA
jgi:uncharacterized membrane protein YfcA